MESDKHYFIEGLFIIGVSIAAAFAFVWLANAGHRDDVLYRIHFTESVSGLSLGDPVKYRGVDVGTVKSMGIDTDDPRRVQVDVKLHKDAPVKTDTRATLKLKGITGTVYIELDGGAPNTKLLVAQTPQGQIPEIEAGRSTLTTVLDQLPKVVDQLPKVIEKFSALENQGKKVLSDVGEVTTKVKEDPSLLQRRPKDKDKKAESER